MIRIVQGNAATELAFKEEKRGGSVHDFKIQ
jgi:hypothetical protein